MPSPRVQGQDSEAYIVSMPGLANVVTYTFALAADCLAVFTLQPVRSMQI